MSLIAILMTLLAPTLVAIYTYNYGRWAWKQELRLGAMGLFVLAAATFGVPVFLVWWQR
jgi:hypothetical protein